ncbi:MAG TPA: hypothetical protein VHM30_16315 [Gemmatimonadaceae bacterium]|nr:hypothetical protein [Gemmatimonadaceae bacterium]
MRLSLPSLLLALAAASPALAQLPAGEPDRFLSKYIGLDAAQIAQAKRGTVVTKVLDVADQDEIAIFGIVAIDAPRATIVRQLGDLQSFLRTPGRSAFSIFSTPATTGDLAGFVVDRSDIDALKQCKRGDCDVKIPGATIDDFRRTIDFSSPQAGAQVSALARERAVRYVNNYRRGGAAAMLQYGDQKSERSAADAFAALLAESPYLFDYVPEFRKYLEAYPNGSLPGATDAIFWSMDRLPSLRPIFGITHLTTWSPDGAPLTLVAAKQLYASHYFLGAFTLTTVLDRPASEGGVYWIVVQRLRFDHLPSGGLLNIRGRVLGKLQEQMKTELAGRKAGFSRK